METRRGAAYKRVNKELDALRKDPLSEFKVELVENDICHWHVSFTGPSESPYEGGTFLLEVKFPRDYPFEPPNIRFLTKVFHTNINVNGDVCVDILGREWSPAVSMSGTLHSLRSMLCDPNPDDASNFEAAIIYIENQEEYYRKAREWTQKFAK